MNLQQVVKFHQIFGIVTPVFGTIFRVFNEKNRPLLIRIKTFSSCFENSSKCYSGGPATVFFNLFILKY